MDRYRRCFRGEKGEETECICMHVDRRVRALHPSSLSTPPESFCTPSCAHNLLPRPLGRSRFLRRPRSGTFFSVSFSRNRRFSTLVLVLEPFTLKSSFSFYSFTVPRLDRFCLSGTHEARGACNCARHIAYGPRKSAT